MQHHLEGVEIVSDKIERVEQSAPFIIVFLGKFSVAIPLFCLKYLFIEAGPSVDHRQSRKYVMKTA